MAYYESTARWGEFPRSLPMIFAGTRQIPCARQDSQPLLRTRRQVFANNWCRHPDILIPTTNILPQSLHRADTPPAELLGAAFAQGIDSRSAGVSYSGCKPPRLTHVMRVLQLLSQFSPRIR